MASLQQLHRVAFLVFAVILTGTAQGLTARGEEAQAARIDFARQVLPILSNKCFVCHGPDARDAADLRLDSEDAATADRGGYRAIDPGKPDASELLARIQSTEQPMPPVNAEKQLNDNERRILMQWVLQGGKYAKHWAFVAPTKAAPPQTNHPHIIDAFIGRKLDASIGFAPEADRRTLARRVALTLTGLPPDPDQLARFLDDDSAEAYEHLVDELLASPRFGEHQARYWLDAVRYGDTHGLHLDNRRGIYPYRDWVVRAFNTNLPLNDFITWQLAGDLLPDPGLEQLIATGYVRLNPSTGEGGAIPEEFQAKNNFDRVETLGTVFLGVSLTCARCHTHKYDPITQTEYYRLLAFFNNTAEPALDGNSYTYGPTVKSPADQTSWTQWRRLTSHRDELLANMETLLNQPRIDEAIAFAAKTAAWRTSEWRVSDVMSSDAAAPPDASTWKALDGLPGVLTGKAAKDSLPAAGEAVWLQTSLEAPTDQSLWLTLSGGAGSGAYLDGSAEPCVQKLSNDRMAATPFRIAEGRHTLLLKIVGDAGVAELRVNLENAWRALVESRDWSACSANDRLRMLTDSQGPFSHDDQAAPVLALVADLERAEANFTTTLVARELEKPRETRLLRRGEYNLATGEPLQPDVLQVMSPLPSAAPRNRLGLAMWLTDRQHPLVARVLINRLWQQVFGRALVRTPEDFGLQGRQPTHPELLDWLAVELHDSQWNLKHMLRLMVASRTFRQSSAWRPGANDPENELFARGPQYRLDAEVLRDIGLWASQLLSPQMGGEGVKPYQPAGMWKALAHPASNTKEYQRDHRRKLYRRSLYVYWKRTSPHPMMTLFDAPDRESSCVRRSRTNTPLQSLGLLNETQRIEMARALAERLLRERPNDTERLERLFVLLACRNPASDELAVCRRLLEQLRQRYAARQDDAEQLLAIGEVQRDPAMDAAELAAWTQVAATVLASDAAIMMY